MGLIWIWARGSGQSRYITNHRCTVMIIIYEKLCNIINHNWKVKQWSKISTKSSTLKQNMVGTFGKQLLRSYHRTTCLESSSSHRMPWPYNFPCLHVRANSVTLSKDNTINSCWYLTVTDVHIPFCSWNSFSFNTSFHFTIWA